MPSELPTGPVPSGWQSATLGEIVRRGGGHVQTGPFGSQLHASDYVPAGVPSIMPVNIGDNRIVEDGIVRITEADAERLSRHRVRAGDIVYSRRGDVERRALVRPEQEGWLCGTGCLKIRLGEGGVDPKFASYYLGHPAVRAWIVRHAIGATMPNLNTSIMEAVPFLVPPPIEQRALAGILGALDEKIELNRQMNRALDAIGRALFKSWFVDFEPVRAKAADGPSSGFAPHVARLFPDSFEDSDHKQIPRGWRVLSLGDVCEFEYGKALKESERKPGRVAVMGSNGQVGWHDSALVQGPGLVIGRKGNPGIVTWVHTDFYPIDTTFYVVPKIKSVPLTYLLQALIRLELPLLGADSAVPGLNRNIAYMSRILVPSPAVLHAFDCQATALADRIHQSEQQNQTTSALRDALLPRLISGELRVSNAERIVGRYA